MRRNGSCTSGLNAPRLTAKCHRSMDRPSGTGSYLRHNGQPLGRRGDLNSSRLAVPQKFETAVSLPWTLTGNRRRSKIVCRHAVGKHLRTRNAVRYHNPEKLRHWLRRCCPRPIIRVLIFVHALRDGPRCTRVSKSSHCFWKNPLVITRIRVRSGSLSGRKCKMQNRVPRGVQHVTATH
jgi:hypothetical protein